MPYVKSEKGNIYCEVVGEGRDVVLVHGWSCNRNSYMAQVSALCQEYRFISIDLRGHGLSDKPANGYAFDDHCKDIKNVMEALAVDNATLVGWSTGGGICTKYAETIKDHIVQLGLIGPTAPRFVSDEDRYPHGIPLAAVEAVIEGEKNDQPANRRFVMEKCFHKRFSRELIDWMWINSMQCPAYVGIQLMEALIAEDLIDQLDQISVPTKIFQGRYDEFCPAEGAFFMADRIKDAEVEMFESLGHAPHIEDPNIFNQSFAKFLSNI